MRTSITLLTFMLLATFGQADAFAQCQHGGGGRGPQQSSLGQSGGFNQAGVNPILAMQQAAMQQAFLQQQFAAHQMRMQQIALREQARLAKLERRRESAEQRRAAEVARREAVRAANIARLSASPPQETFATVEKPATYSVVGSR